MVHIDFSENFTCQYFKEIQSDHFGSSNCQATLHTGVFYDRVENEVKPTSFCTISDSKQHDPCGIWAYLNPVLTMIKQRHPTVSIIHFFNDGPAAQYLQKLNFYYFCTQIQSYGFANGTWNFSEAGHGKGAADGVGGPPQSTMAKRLKNAEAQPDNLSRFKRVFSEAFERELVTYATKMQNRFYGLTTADLQALAFQLAQRNGIQHPFNKKPKTAIQDWVASFMKRSRLRLRSAKPTSMSRLSGFNLV